MKKVIPEKVMHFCDKCEKEIKPNQIDCKGRAEFVGRDYSGAAVGGYTVDFEFCFGCTAKLDAFLKCKEV